MATTELRELADKIEALSPADQLRVAAGLLEAKTPAKLKLALSIAGKVVAEGSAALLMAERAARTPKSP